MPMLQSFTQDFNDIYNKVNSIAATENSYDIHRNSDISRLLDINNYSDHGLTGLGRIANFPAKFLRDISISNENLARDILQDRISNCLRDDDIHFTVREYEDKIRGVVSNKYSFFDDKDVVNILQNTSLANKDYQSLITPERLHIRAIDNETFNIPNDESPLRFMYFIDNSNVGLSSFRINMGVFRQVCSNGLMISQGDYIVYRQIHKGVIDFTTDVDVTIRMFDEKKEELKELITRSSLTESILSELREDVKVDYLAKKLNIGVKEANNVITLFNETYDGHTNWGLTNAITEYARDIQDIEKRESLERQAFRIALAA